MEMLLDKTFHDTSGCMFQVIILLEGEPLNQSSFSFQDYPGTELDPFLWILPDFKQAFLWLALFLLLFHKHQICGVKDKYLSY